jgi:hypothetical protein
VARAPKKIPAVVRAWKSNNDRTMAVGCSSESDVHSEARCAVVQGVVPCHVLVNNSKAVSQSQVRTEVARRSSQDEETVHIDRSCVHRTSAFLLEVVFSTIPPPFSTPPTAGPLSSQFRDSTPLQPPLPNYPARGISLFVGSVWMRRNGL